LYATAIGWVRVVIAWGSAGGGQNNDAAAPGLMFLLIGAVALGWWAVAQFWAWPLRMVTACPSPP